LSTLEKLKDDQIDFLFEAILSLKNKDECYRFFEDIMTIAEIKAMAQRLAVARMLEKGETYTEISEQTGASTATISRVKRCLVYGADGYKLVLERLKEEGLF
jgi:TrpR-related protein YerC/YecD